MDSFAMAIWPVLALMTAAAIFAVLWPLGRHRPAPASGHDVEVYRDQLEELDRDLAEGAIGSAEAEAARVEVSRRLLAAAEQPALQAGSDAIRLRARRLTAVIALVALPLSAGVLYAALGSPELAGQP